ncbi:MAG TPA: GYD domain-containing protein [Clostridia bacterium]|nr:GYD domain-containing protein [Clostridia bacterium]
MPHYLIQASYTPEAWKTLLKKPEDRNQAIRPVIEKLGGSMVNSWYAFGDYDVVLIVEMPDNVSAAAFSLAAMAGGSLRAVKTTPLLELAEGLEAMKRGAKAGYRPPGK